MVYEHAPDPLISFTPLKVEDISAILEVEREAYPEPWSYGMFLDELGNSRSRFMVLWYGEELAGYGGFWLVLDEAHITSVTVRKEYRGRGLGRVLLRYLLDLAMEQWAESALLEVRASNERAQSLYVSERFRIAGIRRKYYRKSGEDAIVMVRKPLRKQDGGIAP